MKVFAIDPGNIESGWVLYDSSSIVAPIIRAGKTENGLILRGVYDGAFVADMYAIEQFVPYGFRRIGMECVYTMEWIGRFVEAIYSVNDALPRLVPRADVAEYICNARKAKDCDIRDAIIHRNGGTRKDAVGTRKEPGRLFGITADMWLALGLAMTVANNRG